MLIKAASGSHDEAKTFVLTHENVLRTARQTIGDGRWPVALPKASAHVRKGSNDVFIKDKTGRHRPTSFSKTLPLIDLVVIAGWLHPFPFRTRP